jgi:hypothetical protein
MGAGRAADQPPGRGSSSCLSRRSARRQQRHHEGPRDARFVPVHPQGDDRTRRTGADAASAGEGPKWEAEVPERVRVPAVFPAKSEQLVVEVLGGTTERGRLASCHPHSRSNNEERTLKSSLYRPLRFSRSSRLLHGSCLFVTADLTRTLGQTVERRRRLLSYTSRFYSHRSPGASSKASSNKCKIF